MDDKTIVTAILHDTIEDTVATGEEIKTLFGPQIAQLVEGVTKLSKIEAQSESERTAENLRKFITAISGDIRVLLVKLADRLHNMRTLHHIPNPEKRRRIAQETLDIYAPLASRVGIQIFHEELNRIAFKELHPNEHQSITARLLHLRKKTGDIIPGIVQKIEALLQENGIAGQVSGREKSPHSIWRKIKTRNMAFDELGDVVAFRILVEKIEQVYTTLGLIHNRWKYVPGRFKDYISLPKRNGYQSLHTTVLGPGLTKIEIQIRTFAQHAQAEQGLAAHWAYKSKTKPLSSDERYPWLDDLLEILEHTEDHKEILEHTRIAMHQEHVFCFTPQGQVIQLPAGACAIDFAYAVHTNLGNQAVGAKVNGRQVPLHTRLRNGAQIEILRSSGQNPQPAWTEFAVTAKARAAIKRYTRLRKREDQIKIGISLLDQIIKRLNQPLSETALDEAIARLEMDDLDTLHCALAMATIQNEDVMEAIIPGSTKGKRKTRKKRHKDPFKGAPVMTEGPALDRLTMGAAVHLAPCCHPIPGDRIIGIRGEDGEIMVHVIRCPNLDKITEPWIDMRWKSEDKLPDFTVVQIKLVLVNTVGALATVTGILSNSEANINNLSLSERSEQCFTFILDLEVRDRRHLSEIISALRALKPVRSAKRTGL